MPTNVFYPSLNDFCTKYFVIGQKPLTAEDVRQLPERAVSECASLGAALGHAVEGAVPGALFGGVAAQAAGPAVEFALDLLDEFLLDGLRKGWHPRMFFDDLRKLDRIENKEKKLASKP